jgi:hypothetical protein
VDYPERQLDYQRLKTAGIRPTRARLSVIACLRAQPQALNHRHVAEFLAEDIDRVTIYRTLHLLEKKISFIASSIAAEQPTMHSALTNNARMEATIISTCISPVTPARKFTVSKCMEIAFCRSTRIFKPN